MKGVIYYTDNRIGEPLNSIVQMNIHRSGLPIVSSSLEPIRFGENEVMNRKRGYVTYIEQIISCLSRSSAKYIFFCEHDVLYHKSHFDFTPPRDDTFYYNKNMWRWKMGNDVAVRYDRMIPLSSGCANRILALKHYLVKQEAILKFGEKEFSSSEPALGRIWGYEPGTKPKKRGGLTDDIFDTWESEHPNIDIRHDKTFSPPKVSLSEFRHPPKWWKEIKVDEIIEWDLKNLL